MTARRTRSWTRLALAGAAVALIGLHLGGPVIAQEDSKPVLNVGGVEGSGGSIKGIVKFEGEQKKRAPIRNMQADANCVAYWQGKEAPLDEKFVFGKNDTLQNVVVYVSKGLEGKTIPQLDKVARIDQVGCVYTPHVLAVQTKQPVEIHNSDPTMHNVNFRSDVNTPFNEAMIKGGVLKKTFDKPDLKGNFSCQVHGWMGAKLVVFDHPYFAITQDDGTFEIKGLPPGEYEISTWHEIPVFKSDQPTYKLTVSEGGASEVSITYSAKARN